MNEWYTARQIAEMRLPGLPKSMQGITRRARVKGWLSRPKKGRGGGTEYHVSSFPLEVREALGIEKAPISIRLRRAQRMQLQIMGMLADIVKELERKS